MICKMGTAYIYPRVVLISLILTASGSLSVSVRHRAREPSRHIDPTLRGHKLEN